MKTLLCKKDYNIYESDFIGRNEYIKGETYIVEIFIDSYDNEDHITYNVYPKENRKRDVYFYIDGKVRYIWDYFYTPEEMRKMKIESL